MNTGLPVETIRNCLNPFVLTYEVGCNHYQILNITKKIITATSRYWIV